MSTGELLDRTFALYKSHLLLFAAIAAPAPALYMLFQLAVAAFGSVTPVMGPGIPGFSPKAVIGSMSVIFVGFFAYLLGWSITNAATVRAVSFVHLGQPTTAGAAYSWLKGRYLRIVGVFLLVTLIVLGGSILLYIAGALIAALLLAAAIKLGTAATAIAVVVGICAIIASILLAITLYVRYSLAVQACVVEDIGILQSLKRSKFLAKGSRNRILTVYMLFAVLQAVIGLTLGLVSSSATAALNSVRLTQAMSALTGFVAGVMTSPLGSIAMSLVYYDERVRKEAFDLQLMMNALDRPTAGAASSAT